MLAEQAFQNLIQQVRAGDDQAAAELVRHYEPAIRRVVRFRLRDRRLRRVFDSMDICQSVLVSFFTGAAAGRFQIDTPDQLVKLLSAMAGNKLAHQIEKQRAQRRDLHRVAACAVEECQVAAQDSSPSQHVAREEIVALFRRGLSPEERRLLDLRDQGREWNDIALEVGASAEALRKQLTRALDRVAQQFRPKEGMAD
ncbi:MAG: sigma-70 family RNA polymerase sigma factor [Planctomycetes bacterium]|nr:sigma-70 family RNA polymerase sigma factor [Planctomycetota bacterium]